MRSDPSMQTLRHVEHTFPPVIDADCRVLILGSVPSVRSMEAGFYYMHPQNRFWPLLGSILDEPLSKMCVSERMERLIARHIALYDSVFACDILGSSDSKVQNVIPSDIPKLMQGTRICHVYCNGARSYRELMRAHPQLRDAVTELPSTSPANASYSLNRLYENWRVMLNYLR